MLCYPLPSRVTYICTSCYSHINQVSCLSLKNNGSEHLFDNSSDLFGNSDIKVIKISAKTNSALNYGVYMRSLYSESTICVFILLLFFSFFPCKGFSQYYNNVNYSAEREHTQGVADSAQDVPDESVGKARDKKGIDGRASGQPEYELQDIVVNGNKKEEWQKPEIQGISRYTLTNADLKDVPASNDDAVTALTALPGIIRTSEGFFGPLVIRGANPGMNNYFIDDIPMNNPLHFGGLHSVINNNFIKDIDVYSSAFPAEFHSAVSAVINMTSVDDVVESACYAEMNILSTAIFLETPILTDKSGSLFLDMPSNESLKEDVENKGYIVATARYGNLGPIIKAMESASDSKESVSPEYWDYQFKFKYIFNSINTATLLLFGQKDIFRYLSKKDKLEDGDDPLFGDADVRTNTSSHTQGVYFDSEFSGDLSNRLMAYNSMQDQYTYWDVPSEGAASWAKDISSNYSPSIFGVKESVSKKYMSDHAEFKGALEYTYYHFTAKGKTLLSNGVMDNVDLSDEDAFYLYNLDEKITNHLFGGYIENKFIYQGLTVVPGIRIDYLDRMGDNTFDARLMASYSLGNNTTLSVAGGHYSYFFQTNPSYFSSNPDLSKMDKGVKPEQARHMSIGGQHDLGLFTVKVEAFSNYFYDKFEPYPHYEQDGAFMLGLSSGELKANGFELMIRKDTLQEQNGMFGWMSYTYTRSREKTGLPTTAGYAGVATNEVGDAFGNKWTTSAFEQRHNLKLIGGYKFWTHIVSGRLQYYTGFPYTPYIDGVYDSNYYELTGLTRYYPVTGYRNSRRFSSSCTLDLRYAHKTDHSWGYINWYVEVQDISLTKKDGEYKWYYDRDYKEGENPRFEDDNDIPFIPSVGVEIRF